MVPVKVGVGVGPPGVSGVVLGSPTGPCCCVVVAAGAKVVVRVVVVVDNVDVPAGAGGKVCNVCVRGWPKALEVTWTTTVFPIGGSEQLAEDGSQEGKGQKDDTVGLQVHGEKMATTAPGGRAKRASRTVARLRLPEDAVDRVNE